MQKQYIPIGQHVYVPRRGPLMPAGVTRVQGYSQDGKRYLVMFDNGSMSEVGSHEIA